MVELNGLLLKAEEAGWLIRLSHTPLFVFKEPMTQLVSAIRTILIREIARPLRFNEWIFPRMVPDEVLGKTGWMTHHRHEAWLLDPQREIVYDPEDPGLSPKRDHFPSLPLRFALDPIQCVSLYFALHGKTLEENSLPLKVFEYQGGWSHRYENSPDGLIRGIEFLRLEFVWIAKEDDAIQLRNDLLLRAVESIRDHLQLEVWVAKGDACFEEPSSIAYAADDIFTPEEINEVYPLPSVDILTSYESYNGGKLEVGSAGRHDRLAHRFEIKVNSGKQVFYPWSGCLGIGLTRLAAAFLNRYGFDPNSKNWPSLVKTAFQRAGS